MSMINRAIRQRDLVPPKMLEQYTCLVVGVGAIGRQVAVQLAAMGAAVLELFDGDTVAIENLAAQGFRECDLNRWKVAATAEVCQSLNSATVIRTHCRRFTKHTLADLPMEKPKLAVFACVDSMLSRSIVWDAALAKAAFFTDGRMAGESLRILATSDPAIDTYYISTLFDDTQAHPAPCTGRSTLYAASIAAGLMISRFAMHLRGIPVPRDSVLNLVADEIVST
jgi:sulfur carrier protein ThiS adenylyltransferase